MIELKGINKKFTLGENSVRVLKDIDLSIKKGEFVAIIGQSGSGKSTLMNIIGCLDTPTNGKYLMNNKDISHFSSDELASLRREKFGFVFQRYNLIPSLSALSNVALPAVYDGIDKNKREKRALNLLNSLDLGDKSQNIPNKLSGGQQQRVSIARALMNGGEIILADEPTGALDSKSGLMVMDNLTNLHKKGHTIILVTHDLNVANYANRIIEIKDGRIIKDEKKDDKIYELKSRQKSKINKIPAFKSSLTESFKMSVGAIFSHKLRSLLTMLGIIIGISSVICVVALGKGSQEKILSSIRAIGTNTITVFPGKSFGDRRVNQVKSLSVSDSDLLNKQPYLDYSTPNTSSTGVLTYKNQSLNGNLRGGGLHYLEVNGLELSHGRGFSKADIDESNSVLIIDENTKNSFFKNENPLDKVLFFERQPFKVIGVVKENDTMFGSSDVLRAYAPFSTVVNKITGDRNVQSITVKVKDSANPQVAETRLTDLLVAKHGKKDFYTRNSDTIRQTVEATTNTMRILISGVALISLIVGGIGVMNIMLVSVTERTKEIGIRMAVGAKQSDILMQFLIEAVLLCVIGGVIGLGLAYAIGFLFNNLNIDFYMKFSLTPALVALITSSFIGVVFGYLPARNASKLNPIDALSQE
ncbi:MacB family efflux pump subunit [Campylobacter corcagiensis]|uniref:Pyoverdine export ATP-binding/permease protein PvdT n=1 Tax=Campylobacter corcagiensis TaxID=1448857 RepID=A0A7M1LFE9_9BACT|nr:MacB family efflux pump subunit [Campylobacter corcagiensis]QKF64794.1 macrolide-specific efflux protein, ATP-binding/permease protein MacB [Campylobacter corcagiensis]QOQ87043.1 MacB family efflux pump subunit [Campylobacter corcagiensis]